MKSFSRFLIALTCCFLLASVSSPVLAADNPRVALKTNVGEIVLELYPDKAPRSVENFVRYVKHGHYNGTIFHRVIDHFMIQGGGFDQNLRQRPTSAPIRNEAANGLKNNRYTIAMARTSAPHSATAQFFINVNDNRFLDYPGQDGWGYAVFGKVVKGTDVVDRIKQVPTDRQNIPLSPIVIESATLIK